MPTSLDALRDIHLPDPVSGWPPAVGYWLLLALAAIAVVLWYLRYRRFAIRRAASQELKLLELQFKTHNDSHALARAVNVMLRRTLLSLEPRDQVASLTGQNWMQRVHACVAESGFTFSDRVQQLLTEDVYKASTEVDAKALVSECRQWIQQLPPRAVA